MRLERNYWKCLEYVTVASPTICKTLKYMGCSRHVAIHRSDELRAKFMAEVSLFDPSMLIWLDESGYDQRNSTRKWGYSVRGIPPRDHRLLVRGKRYSVIPIGNYEWRKI